MSHVSVPKTYKLYIGGAFPRSESGRVYPVNDSSGEFVAHAAQASRKDARDAVVAARAALSGWSGTTSYNRGQVLYRIAELLEGRRGQFIDELRATDGLTAGAARTHVNTAIDTWVWYAGWADKYAQVAGNTNPVSGPYFNISTPEPMGVVAAIAPQDGGLLGLVETIAPIIVSGNTAVVVASETSPFAAISLGEVMATSDVPGGVVNVLTGVSTEIAPWLAGHADVNGLDVSEAQHCDWVELQIAAAETLTRVLSPTQGIEPRSLERLTFFTETKTVWHTKSLI